MSAHGTKPDAGTIDDGTNVCQGFTLKHPVPFKPGANDEDFFADQVWFLHALMKMGEGGKEAFATLNQLTLGLTIWASICRSGAFAGFCLRQKFVFRAPFCKSDNKLDHYDEIHVVTDFIYTWKSSQVVDIQVQCLPSKRKATDKVPTSGGSSSGTPTHTPTEVAKVGASYSTGLLPGHDHNDFEHSDTVQLVQLDIRDIDGNLLFPWEWPKHLTFRTIAVIKASLKRWIMPATGWNRPPRLISIKSLRSLSESSPKGSPRVTVYEGDLAGDLFTSKKVKLG
ncbi:hypothetical protein EXIGLDRAFT_697476 [Exidia glandulosa HHB12029]|uniref:Uncharacterized protein n=1 Tax=Exidia glandulosa HHB12029 TaxID=1314781 RepID=A0A165ESB2_EXIGL|nr:hypothetical protein EXIGLDRAFT_697476 [Exidia glandulosa HHB12029]